MFTQASNSSVGREVLGGVLRCNGSGQIIPILPPSDAAGGFFEVIITNATTLTVSSGTFAGSSGSGTSTVALATTPSPHYRLLSDGSSWRVYSVREAAILGSPATGTPLLSGSIVRSISAGTNVSLAVQDNSVRISVPYIAGNTLITTGATTLSAQIVYGGFVTVSGTPPFTPYTITLPSPVTVP